MSGLVIIQQVLTYFLTAGFASAIAYAARLSKRVTILEERMVVCQNTIDKANTIQDKLINVLDDIKDRLVRIETKLESKDEKNNK